MGGLARRAWVIEEIKRTYPGVPVLPLDAGNFFDLPTEKGERQTKILVEAMGRLGYEVANVGEREVRLGYDDFRKHVEGASFRFVSANIVRAGDQSAIFDPSTVVEVPRAEGAPIRVGVTGAARFNPVFRKPGPDDSEMTIIHPIEPVRKQVEALRAKDVDVVVLLSAMPIEDVSRLVDEVPGIDFVFGAFAGRSTVNPERVGDTFVTYLDNRGQRVSETRVFLETDGPNGSWATLHRLGREYPADPKMVGFLKSRVPTQPSGAEATKLAAPAEDPARDDPKLSAGGVPFVGSAECRRCHAAQHAQWETSDHARAMHTLKNVKKETDAACVSCHVTGWGAAGGFRSLDATPTLASVGCESCHGPGRPHLVNLASRYGTVEVSTCTPCHDRANDPDFDYYALRPKVAHGSRASNVAGP